MDTYVTKGDLLAKLDDAALRDELAVAEIVAKQAAAALEKVNAELEAARREQDAMALVLQGELSIAELEHQKVLGEGGELACQLVAVLGDLATAKKRLQFAESLQEATPSDERSREAEVDLQLMALEAREAIRVAEARKKFLKDHERPYQTALRNGAVAQKKLQMVMQKNGLERSVQSAKFEVLVKKTAAAAAKRKLKQIEKQIVNCKIVAPQDGVVLYAAASRNNRTAPIEEGAAVRERQPLVRVSDPSGMQVKVRINESRISRVRAGQSARILCDAFPDKPFQGRVVQVSDVPEPSSWLSPDVKEYAAIVSISQPTESLRIGLTALVEIDASDVD